METKPDDIPQDVLTTARILTFELETFVQHDPAMDNPRGNEASEKLVSLFAKAIMSERKRALAVADQLAEDCLSHSEQASAKGNKLQAKASIAQAKVLADFINLMRTR